MYRMDNPMNLERSNYPSNNSQICCLIENNLRCHRLSGNACCSKPIQRKMLSNQHPKHLSIDEAAKHIYICDHHKGVIQSWRSISNKRKKKDDDDDNNSMDEYTGYNANYDDYPVVDLSSLQVNTLRRYKRHYRVTTKPGLNKPQLVECLEHHFQNIPVIEKEAITFFIYMVKTNKNKLDHKNGPNQ